MSLHLNQVFFSGGGKDVPCLLVPCNPNGFFFKEKVARQLLDALSRGARVSTEGFAPLHRDIIPPQPMRSPVDALTPTLPPSLQPESCPISGWPSSVQMCACPRKCATVDRRVLGGVGSWLLLVIPAWGPQDTILDHDGLW